MTHRRSSVFLGSFIVGEVPPDLTYQFLTSTGTPINLTGFSTVRFHWGLRDFGGNIIDPVERAGVLVDAASGLVSYTWQGDEFDVTGTHAGLFYVHDGTTQYASELITWNVCSPIGTPPEP